MIPYINSPLLGATVGMVLAAVANIAFGVSIALGVTAAIFLTMWFSSGAEKRVHKTIFREKELPEWEQRQNRADLERAWEAQAFLRSTTGRIVCGVLIAGSLWMVTVYGGVERCAEYDYQCQEGYTPIGRY